MKKYFTQKFFYMVFALGFAVITWFAVRTAISFETTIPEVPIELKVSDGWAILSQSEIAVKLYVQGYQDSVRELDRNNIKAVIDLTGNDSSGTKTHAILNKNIQGLEKALVKVTKIEPDSIDVVLANEISKKVRIVGKITDKSPVGTVVEVVCDPLNAIIYGPTQMVDHVEWVQTAPVEVDGRIESFSKRTKVLPPSGTRGVRIDPSEVKLTVNIKTSLEKREWQNIPVAQLSSSSTAVGALITPARVNITVTGTAETLLAMTNIAPRAFIDSEGLNALLEYELPVKVYFPPGFEVRAVAEPGFVKFVPGTK